ncbi:hypothetical protein CRG98_017952 [Punica granatum]|uniref:Uncharacterized protein n=1 Tax=Punica granatum TaxID=22663 RepID=A0A2I0K0K4_PUNGR|nr:hypothetical protein CRG98_017952 [Punica granatum]
MPRLGQGRAGRAALTGCPGLPAFKKKKIGQVGQGRAALTGCPRSPPARNCPKSRASEVPIDHGEAPAAPRTIPHVHSGRHRGVQGARTAGPSPVAAAFLPIPAALRLTGLGPFLFLCRLGPFRPKVPSPAQRSSGRFSFGRSGPIRSGPIHPVIFFILTEKPFNFPN